MRRMLLLVAVALAWVAAPVQAGPLPTAFSYQSRIVGDPFQPPMGDPVPGSDWLYAASMGSGDTAAVFTSMMGWTTGSTNTPLTVGSIQIYSAIMEGQDYQATFNTMGMGGTYSGGYTLTLALRDEATGAVGEFDFRGLVEGTLSLPAFGAVESTITNRRDSAFVLSQTVGNTLYTVTLDEFKSPLAPYVRVGDSTYEQGDDPAPYRVTVQVGDGGTPAVPEPATLALAGVGLALVGVRRLRRV